MASGTLVQWPQALWWNGLRHSGAMASGTLVQWPQALWWNGFRHSEMSWSAFAGSISVALLHLYLFCIEHQQ